MLEVPKKTQYKMSITQPSRYLVMLSYSEIKKYSQIHLIKFPWYFLEHSNAEIYTQKVFGNYVEGMCPFSSQVQIPAIGSSSWKK